MNYTKTYNALEMLRTALYTAPGQVELINVSFEFHEELKRRPLPDRNTIVPAAFGATVVVDPRLKGYAFSITRKTEQPNAILR